MLLAANADINAKDNVSRILCVYMCLKLRRCFWMMFCCCLGAIYLTQCFLFYPPFFFFFSFSFFFRVVGLPSILFLSMVVRMSLWCCWQPMLTSMPKIMLVGYYVYICAPSCVGVCLFVLKDFLFFIFLFFVCSQRKEILLSNFLFSIFFVSFILDG